MAFQMRMKMFYFHFCNQSCIVEVMFNLRTFSQSLVTVFEIFNVAFAF